MSYASVQIAGNQIQSLNVIDIVTQPFGNQHMIVNEAPFSRPGRFKLQGYLQMSTTAINFTNGMIAVLLKINNVPTTLYESRIPFSKALTVVIPQIFIDVVDPSITTIEIILNGVTVNPAGDPNYTLSVFGGNNDIQKSHIYLQY